MVSSLILLCQHTMARIFSQRILNPIKSNYHKILPFSTYPIPKTNTYIIVSFWSSIGIGFGIGSYYARKEYLKSDYIAACKSIFYYLFPVILIWHLGIPVAMKSQQISMLFSHLTRLITLSFLSICGIYETYNISKSIIYEEKKLD